jgi:hypothetical protein
MRAPPLLAKTYREWAVTQPSRLQELLDTFEASGDIIRDFMAAMRELSQSALVQLINPTEGRRQSLLEGIERVIARPCWDYFRDGGTEIIGIQRASFTTVHLLFAREVLEGAISDDLDRRLLTAIAEKGCEPCYATVYDMDHPETVIGWNFDNDHAGFYDISMHRWPTILGANNLRAAPTGALGLGALALRGFDPRAEQWLQTAVSSTERFLQLFSPDGSFFEGISYLGYSLRTTLPFIDAHRRLIGDVDWMRQVNFNGMLDYIMTMQMGKKEDGSPDVVNFSDSRNSVFPGAISLLGKYTQNPLAGYAAKEAGTVAFMYDFLWYRPDAPSQPPREALLNMRNDLDWIICRTGWKPEDNVLAFKSGAPANHEHADRHHITFKAYGERLLNDHFGAAYDRRDPGWKMRQTEAHNALTIDGRGHHYVDGTEGTNDSLAYANILHYEDHGEHVWWTSDATPGYLIENYHVHQVLRSVVYAKPDVIVVMDQIRFRYRPQVIAARFYPDNADGAGGVEVDGDRFVISRPNAQLHGRFAANTEAVAQTTRLDVPSETGDFPCVKIAAPEALTHHLITVLAAKPAGEAPVPELDITRENGNWRVQAGAVTVELRPGTHEPTVVVS